MQWILAALGCIVESPLDIAEEWQKVGQYEKAIQLYQSSLESEKDPEKVWFSKYRIGKCHEDLKQWEDALYWYLEAYQADPNRTEPLLSISTHYRLIGQNDLAYIFAKFGSRIPNHPYQFEEELSIASYYTSFREEGFGAVNHLLLNRKVPHNIREQAYRNLLFYIEPLKNASYIPIDIDLPYIRDELRFNPMNPSILKTKEGYSVICRAVNYTQRGAKHFQTYDEDGIYRSRNFLLQYDRELNLLSQKEIIDSIPREKFGHSIVEGLEDCRIFEFYDEPWFTCTTTNTNPTGSVQISLCKMGRKNSKYYVPLESLTPLRGPDPHRCEKNWLPFVLDGKLYTIYSYDPFTIFAPDVETGECTLAYQYIPEHDFSHFRGSGGPIPFDDGYLLLVHEITFHLDWERVYLHRFLFLSNDLVVTKTSKPFIFKHQGVEYCCSMTLDHTESKLILSIGIEDKEAHLCELECETVRSMLTNL